jgi:hypothetical protein
MCLYLCRLTKLSANNRIKVRLRERLQYILMFQTTSGMKVKQECYF